MLQRVRKLLPQAMPLFWLVFAAFWLHALIPAGFMPSAGKSGLFEICSGFAGLIDKAPSSPDAPKKHHSPCSFAGAGIATVPDFVALLAAPVVFADPVLPRVVDVFQRAAQAALPPARGPPVRV